MPTHYATITDNPFFAKIKENINLEKKENNDKNCDEVFYEYLKVLANKCNHKYFIFAFKFVVLFRECLNKFKLNEKDVSKEYTQCNNSDQVPDLCNEFINDFMEVLMKENGYWLRKTLDSFKKIDYLKRYIFYEQMLKLVSIRYNILVKFREIGSHKRFANDLDRILQGLYTIAFRDKNRCEYNLLNTIEYYY